MFSGSGTTLAASVAYDPWGTVLASGRMIGRLGFQSASTASAARTTTSAQLAQDTRDMDQHQRDVQFTGDEIARQQAEYARGERESKTSLFDILIQVGVGMLLDMIGYNAVVGCLEGSAMDCIDLASNFLGPIKAFKMARSLYKAIDRALSGYRMWRRIIDGARTLMNRASMLMNQARKHLSDLMQKVPKKPKPPKKKIKPPAKKKPKQKAKQRPRVKSSEQAKPPKAKTSKKKAERPEKERPDRPERPAGSDRPSVAEQPAEQRNFVDPGKSNDPAPAKPEACHSFAPDTRVLMAGGSTRPIAEVNVGDKVATTDPETGENSDQQVTLLHANRDRELTDVTVSSAPASADPAVSEGKGGRSTRGPTGSTLETTANHPFWDATTGEWVDAAELTPGTSTLVGPDGEIQYVVAVRTFTGARVMRDLTVDNTHTYYVLAGTKPVLVHNCGEEPAEVTVRWQPGMPKAEFNRKAAELQALSDAGKLFKAPNPVNRDSSVTGKYKADLIRRVYDQYGETNPGFADALKSRILTRMDPDHVWELQLGGPDVSSNLRMLDRFTNQQIGMRQIWPQIRSLPDHTPIKIIIEGPS